MKHRDWSDLSPAESAAQERYVYEHRHGEVPDDMEQYTPDELAALDEAASADEMADAGAYDHDPSLRDEGAKWGGQFGAQQ